MTRRPKESEAGTSSIVEAAIITIDETGSVIEFNPCAAALFGYPVDEALGRNMADLIIPAEYREKYAASLNAFFQTGGSKMPATRLEMSAMRADGSIFPMELTVIPVGLGTRNFFTAFIRDVTDQKTAATLNARLERIAEDCLNEIYVFDAETLHFVQVNRSARENLGYSMDQLKELTPLDLTPQFDAQSFAKIVAPLRDGSTERVTFETTHRRRDGPIYDVEVQLRLGRAETPPLFVADIEDITERKRTEEILRRSRKMEAVGQFSGEFAHDFNNLLGIIIGNLDLLEDEIEGNQAAREILDATQRAALRSSELIESLLAHSRKSADAP